jgi:hypothetical protein
MNTNLTEILKAIPDFEDFMKLADEIGELSFHKMQLENKLKGREALVFQEAMKKPLENGKLPSASYVTNAYLHTGFDGELMEDREKLADVTAMLDKKKIQLNIYKDMLDVWRTLSANSRQAQL